MGPLWLLDGNNVMGCVPDGWWRDRAGAARRLAEQARAWIDRRGDGRGEGETAVLVFDGRAVEEVAAVGGGRLEVGFAERGGRAWEGAAEAPSHEGSGADAADDVLVARAWEEVARGRVVVVVSSDRGLRARLPPGVEVRGARRWREEAG